jgi:hypothetical protein
MGPCTLRPWRPFSPDCPPLLGTRQLFSENMDVRPPVLLPPSHHKSWVPHIGPLHWALHWALHWSHNWCPTTLPHVASGCSQGHSRAQRDREHGGRHMFKTHPVQLHCRVCASATVEGQRLISPKQFQGDSGRPGRRGPPGEPGDKGSKVSS